MFNHHRECTSYNPGHCVHWIQVKLSRDEQPEPLEVRLARRCGFQVDVVLDGSAETWMFHDAPTTRQGLDSWTEGESAHLRSHGLLVLTGGACLYPCRDVSQWKDCQESVGDGVSPH